MSVRTQIYLPEDLYHKLRLRGQQTGKSLAQQVRESLVLYLANDAEETALPDDPIWKLVGIGASGLRDVSERHDDYLYGFDKGKQDGAEERK